MKKKKTNIKKFLAIIKQIENVRSKNNKIDGFIDYHSCRTRSIYQNIKKIIARDKSIKNLQKN